MPNLFEEKPSLPSRQFLDLIQDGVLIINHEGIILEGNIFAANLLLFTREQLISRSIFDSLQSNLNSSVFFRNINQYKTVAMHDKNGKVFFVETCVHSLLNNLYCVLFHQQSSQSVLERSERLLNETQQLAKMGAWDYNLRTQTTYWTDELYRLHGYSLEKGVDDVQKVIQESLNQFEPEGRAKVKTAFEECITQGTPYDIESEFYKATGEKIWVRTMAKGIIENGEVIRAIGYFSDITDQKKAEAEMQENNEKLQAIINTTQDGFLIVREDQKIIDVNQVYCDLSGYSREELLTMTVDDLGLEHYREPTNNAIQKAIKFGSSQFETKHKCKNGIVLDFEVSATYFKQKKYFLAFLRNITRRKQAEEQLVRISERLTLAKDSAGIGVWDWDLKTGQLIWDDWMFRIFKVDPITFQGTFEEWKTTLHPEDAEQTIETINQTLLNKQNLEIEFRIIHPDQSIHFIKGIGALTLGEDGQAVRMTGVNYDITTQKQTEMALEKRIFALTQPMEKITDINFEDLFNLEEIQKLQDEFSNATGVASLITHPDGRPITKPSNFCHLCNNIIRKTKLGVENCFKSDAAIGKFNPAGPIVQTCMSGGLWDAGAGITVDGKHIANWLIGQVRNEAQSEEAMREYARVIGVNEETFMQAYYQVPSMSDHQFRNIAQALHTLTNQLSTSAYQNIQQARFIGERKKIEKALFDSELRFRKIFADHDAVMYLINPDNGTILDANQAASNFYGYSLEELRGMNINQINQTTPEIVFQEMKAALNSDKKYFIFPHRLANGEIRTVEIYSSKINIDEKEVLYSIVHDITQRKLAENQLKDQLDELRRWHMATLGRENRVIELKKEVNQILKEHNLPIKYSSVEEDHS